MIITIDGPAGTGKSTVAQMLAERLEFDFLDTGAMYRAIGLAVLRAGVVLEDLGAVAEVAHRSTVSFDWSRRPPAVLLDGAPVRELLRGPETTRAASLVAVVPDVRAILVREQQRIGRERTNLVTEGRDQGTVVFPQAELKFYLDAAPEERARRRLGQLEASGREADYEEILREIIIRDRRDAGRAVGPLAVPKDARVVDTTQMQRDQVIEHLVECARGRLEA